MNSVLLTVARVLAAVAGLLALVAAISSIPATVAAGSGTAMVETWRTIGFFTFAALFGYLAVRPHSVGIWLIVLANKLALTIAALLFGPGADGAMTSALWDGALVVILGAGTTLALLSMRSKSGTSAQGNDS